MTPFKRKDRPNEGYRIRLRLPGFGFIGEYQTGSMSRATARRMHAGMREIALTRPALVRLLIEKKVSLPDLWVAYLEDRLDEIQQQAGDPTIDAAVGAYEPFCQDSRARAGLAQLLELIPPGARLSWLSGPNIQAVYEKALSAGRKPNSVRRSLHRAIVELLTHAIGAAGRAARFEGVTVPGEDDTRDVELTPEEIRRVMDECPIAFRRLVVVAMLTGVDQGPLLATQRRHFEDGDLPLLHVRTTDTKSRARRRIIVLSPPAAAYMRAAAAGLGPSERLFPWTRWQVRKQWDAVREAAHVPELRFKDLRHLLPTALAALGCDRRTIQAILGHAPGSKMTDRYIAPAGSVEWMARAAERLGLGSAHVRVAGE